MDYSLWELQRVGHDLVTEHVHLDIYTTVQ